MKIIHTKETPAGVMIIKEDEKHTRYEIFTRAGFWRGGKIYTAEKVVEILSGTAIITLEIEGKDKEIQINSSDGKFLIPRGIANIFYFPEDTHMSETFVKGAKSQDYERYRALKK